MRNRVWSLFLSLCLLLSLVSGVLPYAFAAGEPSNLEVVWDMENLPEDLFAAEVAWDMTGTYGGHANGNMEASRANGKGLNGSAAAAITFTKTAPASWDNGVYLRLTEDEKANTDWYGATQLWFWVDLSAFTNSEIYMDLAVDGVFPGLDQPYYLIQGGKQVTKYTAKTWEGATFGRLGFPKAYKGWVGIELSGFNATFGNVQSVGFGFAPTGDKSRFPLSMYVDQLSIVRGDKALGALEGTGELYNKDTAAGSNKIYTNLTGINQTVTSYGASGAWWSTGWGTDKFVDNLLNVVFTDAGAGLNNYRHNIGGGVLDDRSDADGMTWSRRALSPLTPDGKYDEDRDIGAWTVYKKLNEMNTIDNFTLFINSPPSTMTNSGMTYGDEWADSYSNLRKDCYEAFASYVVDMVQLYNWCGMQVDYVSPINEPQWDWIGGQEGCHYTGTEAVEILTLVIKELQERSKEDPTIAHVKVSLAECANWTDKTYINYLYMQLKAKPELWDKIDHLACHSYGTDQSAKERLARDFKSLGADVTFRQTEYGPSYAQPDLTISSALNVARVMWEDLTILNVDGWSYWLAGANGLYTDGLVYFNIGAEDIMPAKRLWAMGQYARFTKGAIRVDVDAYGMPKKVKTSAFVNPAEGTLVYVVVNESTSDETFSFVGLPAGSVAEVWETSAIRDLEKRGTMTADAGYALPAESITTFVFHNIKFEDVQSSGNPDNPVKTEVNVNFDYSIFYASSEEPEQGGNTQDPTQGGDSQDPTQGGNQKPTQGDSKDPTTGSKPADGTQPSDPAAPSVDASGIITTLVIVAVVLIGAAVAIVVISRKRKN